MSATVTIADITAALRDAGIDFTVEHRGTENESVVVGDLHIAPAVTETGEMCEGVDSCDSTDRHDWHETVADAVERAALHVGRVQ